jgi:hypothetical protein
MSKRTAARNLTLLENAAILNALEPIRKRGQTPSTAMKNWGKRPIRGGLTPFPDRLLVPR